jgi:feruloyl-CoA synthase
LSAAIREARLGPFDLTLERRADGTLHARSPHALGAYPARLTARLEHWATQAPTRSFLAQRDATGAWRRLTYAETLRQVRRLGQALLARGLSAERPLVILSGNDLEHALLALAAQHVGIPYAPLSPAYSLASQDFGKLRTVIGLLRPGLVFAASGDSFAAAIAAAVPRATSSRSRPSRCRSRGPPFSPSCSPPSRPAPSRRRRRGSAPTPSESSCSPRAQPPSPRR